MDGEKVKALLEKTLLGDGLTPASLRGGESCRADMDMDTYRVVPSENADETRKKLYLFARGNRIATLNRSPVFTG